MVENKMEDQFSSTEWEPLQKFEEAVLPEWPKDVLPKIAQNYVEELSRWTETPIEMASMIFLSIVATASQAKFEVEVTPGYKEPLALWTIVALPPGSRKSSVYSELILPIIKWEEKIKDELEPFVKAEISKRKTLEVKIQRLRNEAAKKDDDIEFVKIQNQIVHFENEIDNLTNIPQLWTGDITSEQLVTLMSLNNGSTSILSDEGGIFDIISGLYSKGRSNIDLFLQGYSGSPVKPVIAP